MRLWQYREGDGTQIVRHPGEGESAPLREGVEAARVLFRRRKRARVDRNLAAGFSRRRRESPWARVPRPFRRPCSQGRALEPQSWGRCPQERRSKRSPGVKALRSGSRRTAAAPRRAAAALKRYAASGRSICGVPSRFVVKPISKVRLVKRSLHVMGRYVRECFANRHVPADLIRHRPRNRGD